MKSAFLLLKFIPLNFLLTLNQSVITYLTEKFAGFGRLRAHFFPLARKHMIAKNSYYLKHFVIKPTFIYS